jgi:NAD(P)H-dependent flavin oxidoreductase YrpB (nitropropane dioxygenase family)
MTALVLTKSRIGETSQVVRRLKAIEGVLKVDATCGPADGVVIVGAEAVGHLGNVVYNEIRDSAGVEDTMALPVVRE